MKNNYLAFDIETAKVMPETEKNWRSCRPLGIACAATLLCDTDEVTLWQGADRLTQPEAAGLVAYLRAMVRQGYTNRYVGMEDLAKRYEGYGQTGRMEILSA
jgi:hypothetical protein